MTSTTNSTSRRGPPVTGPWPPSPWDGIPLTGEQRLKRIEALGERIAGHVRFMCQVASLEGSSAEMKERALTAFYERMILVETQLGRLREDLVLG
jgi:hypothetical protein